MPPPAAPPGPITAPPPSVPAAPSTTAPAPTTPPRARTASPKNPRWERIRRWLKPPRRLRTTRDGRFFLLLTVAVGLAAINTGNNLLYLLLGMLLALIVVSGIMSELSLRRLTVVRRLPARAQVGRPHLVEIEVHNHKKRVPSYAIEIEDLREGQPADKRCFFLKISPGAVQVAAYRRTPARRGLDRHVGFRVATRFPFGLFEKSRELTAEGELVTYPAVDPVKLPPLTAGPRGGGNASPGRGIGDEILGVRPMREGDDPRDIYWRKSALMGQMVLRERARDTQRNVSLLLDAHHPGERPDDAWLAQFERRIRDVASRAVAHLRRGDQVIVTASTGARVRADRSVGADPLLRMLALLEAEPAPERPTRPNLRQPAPPAENAGPANVDPLRPPTRDPAPPASEVA